MQHSSGPRKTANLSASCHRDWQPCRDPKSRKSDGSDSTTREPWVASFGIARAFHLAAKGKGVGRAYSNLTMFRCPQRPPSR